MTDDDFWADIEPVEDRYGGGYRTRHVILKRRHASLAFSTYSCRLGDKIAPNRDYASEGLCCDTGESWKFIDAVGIGLKIGGKPVMLTPGTVRACPWECEYTYGDGERTLHVAYYLFNTPQGGAGRVKARLEGHPAEASIVFEPFFDIRPFTGDGGDMEGAVEGNGIFVSAGGNSACVRLESGEARASVREVTWKYKLGLGDRMKDDGHIRPVPETGRIRSFGELEAHGSIAEMRFSGAGSRNAALKLLDHKDTRGEDQQAADGIRKAVIPGYSGTEQEKAVVWRALGMAAFLDDSGIQAGGILSRKVALRDQFEGLLQNFHTIKKAYGMDCIKSLLLKAYGRQDEWGRIGPQPEATLIAFILAGMAVKETNDGDLAKISEEAFRRYLAGVSACHMMRDGPPMIRPNGLVSVAPALAWMDGCRDIEGQQVPERLSPEWARELVDRNAVDELRLQKYLLPEINARWVRCLEAGWLFTKYVRDFRLADRCRMIYYRAREAYKKTFFDESAGFIYNMVTTDESALGRRHDPAHGSAGVTAAAILGTDVFTLRELSGMAQAAKKHLLRKKWGQPFGVAVLDNAECVYLDRKKEYGGTVCPGDTPYLVRLLRMAGDHDIASRVLGANLRHQMEEGFVFYNAEVFSCDHGLTPSADPARWWSQWVDPYLEGRP